MTAINGANPQVYTGNVSSPTLKQIIAADPIYRAESSGQELEADVYQSAKPEQTAENHKKSGWLGKTLGTLTGLTALAYATGAALLTRGKVKSSAGTEQAIKGFKAVWKEFATHLKTPIASIKQNWLSGKKAVTKSKEFFKATKEEGEKPWSQLYKKVKDYLVDEKALISETFKKAPKEAV